MKPIDLREQLLKAIRASGKSMFALSRESGVGYASLHGLVRGGNNPSIATVTKLANVLDLELAKRRKGS